MNRIVHPALITVGLALLVAGALAGCHQQPTYVYGPLNDPRPIERLDVPAHHAVPDQTIRDETDWANKRLP